VFYSVKLNYTGEDGDSDMSHNGDISNWGNLTPAVREEIEKLLRERKKILAIRLYRSHTNASLKEAKDSVESVATNMGIAPASGCATALFSAAPIVGCLTLLVFNTIIPF